MGGIQRLQIGEILNLSMQLIIHSVRKIRQAVQRRHGDNLLEYVFRHFEFSIEWRRRHWINLNQVGKKVALK
jgi:hypothetical protein